MRTICKDFSYRDRHYSIVYDGKHYMTVDHKFIGADGRLTKELRYNDGLHTSEDLDQCIRVTKNELDVLYYESQGMTRAQAFVKVFPEISIEIAEKLFS